MRRLLTLAIIGLLIATGYYYFSVLNNKDKIGAEPQISPTKMKITQVPTSFNDLFAVLGATTSELWESGLSGLNNVTDGKAEPVINKAVSDLQERIKELPKEQYEKVKYEFCKDVVTSFEEKK